MTSTITIEAHPASPNLAVQVTVWSSEENSRVGYLIADGATQVVTISGNDTLSISEVPMCYVPAPSTTG